LIEAADHRLKLARLATACAVRSFSCENGNVIVRKCHVDFIAGFLDSIYSTRACGYDEYSRIQLRQINVPFDALAIAKEFDVIAHAYDLANSLLESDGFLHTDIEDWTGCDREIARNIISAFVRGFAIKRAKKYYVKTQPFIDFLKKALENGALKSKTMAEIVSKEEF
jgi:hypothetical protein